MATSASILDFRITPQPDESSCGPACLHSVYRYLNHDATLEKLRHEIEQLEEGGTLSVYLGLHALDAGFDATIYTCNLQMFDPTWFAPQTLGATAMQEKLRAQLKHRRSHKFRQASEAYIRFLDRGGYLFMEDVTEELFLSLFKRRLPVIVGLSATWLYRAMRERPDDNKDDDIAGSPLGHFVVVHGVDPSARVAYIADPYLQKPFPGAHAYTISVDRLIGAIMLGIVTYDAKLLVIQPRATKAV
ncbi:MAG: hypothetical protein GC164_00480 [Phycisphaera sp.]|nr:hypothetical protein [Phycisphaera sp.]